MKYGPDPNRHLTPQEQADHDRSVHDYPDMQFSPTEYVIIDVERSIMGLVKIWLFALVVFITLAAVVLMINQTTPVDISPMIMFILLAGTVIIPIAGGMIGTYVFRRNYFLVTNERIFARIQYTPFAQQSQNVEIEHIEDCSYRQTGIMQMLFDYGSIRLSTIGDEQTYTFTYVSRPKEQFRIINSVVQQVDESAPTRYKELPPNPHNNK